MRNYILLLSAIFPVSLLSSCELAKGIFKAGYYVGIFAVIAVVLVIWWITTWFKQK